MKYGLNILQCTKSRYYLANIVIYNLCVTCYRGATHTQRQYLSNILILHNNKCTFQFDSYGMWWHSDLCFLQMRICILMDLNWISVNLSTKHWFSQSAHFGALASMWEVLVGKHWDLQPRLPCLLPVQPGLFKICACGSFYYFDLYAAGILMPFDIYTFWNHYSHCNEYALGTRHVRKKRKREWKWCERDVILFTIIVIGMNMHWGGWTVVPRVRERKQSSLWEEPGPGITEELEKLAEWLGPTFFCDFSYWCGRAPSPPWP